MFGALSIVIAIAVLTGFAQMTNSTSGSKNDIKNVQSIEPLKSLKSSQCKLVVAKEETIEVPSGQTKFGGFPFLREDFKWPHFEDIPYLFLGQINFEQLREKYRHGALPHNGMLYMFIRPNMTFNYDASDAFNAKFVYLEEISEDFDTHEIEIPTLAERAITLLPQPSYLPVDDPQVLTQVYDEDAIERYKTFLTDEISHPESPKFCGHPDVLHDEMPERCQCYSTNITMDSISELTKDEMEIFKVGTQQWIHLMQLPSAMFNDNDLLPDGMYHFYIKRSDLLSRNFTKIWTIRN